MDASAELHGRTILVTGANAGIGYWCVEQLAAHGARVILGCRSTERARQAVEAVSSRVAAADLRILPLDLGSLASVAEAASGLDEPLHGVICNAGVKAAQREARTSDGLDLMVGTNFLGHFALIARLTHTLAEDARVVAVGSLAHRFAPIAPATLTAPWRGSSLRQYGRSKAAMTRAVVQGKDGGARPIVHAATDAEVVGGDYWGPSGALEFRGTPTRVIASEEVRSPAVGTALWAAAEKITGVAFPA